MLVKWYIVNIVMLLYVTKGSARTSKVLDSSGNNEEVNEEELAKQLEEAVNDLKLVEKLEKETNSSRDSRGLLKKLSFLAGVKVGGLLQSSGTLAASNSIRVFGKVLNTALSVSYGAADELEELPVINRPGLIQEGEISRPLNAEFTKPTDEANSGTDVTEGNVKDSWSENGPPVYPARSPLQSIRDNFLKQHNRLVSRVNHKFLRYS